MDSPISLSVDTGFSFFLALGVIYAVQGVKWLCEILPTTKTNNIPGWAWVGSALVISVGVCWGLKVDALESILKAADVTIGTPYSYWATGLAIGISSNVMFAITKPLRKKLRTEEGKILTLPAGQNLPDLSVSEPVFVPETATKSVDASSEIPQETSVKPPELSTDNLEPVCENTAEIDKSGTNAVDLHTQQSSTSAGNSIHNSQSGSQPSQSGFVTGPTHDNPTHVMVPAQWRKARLLTEWRDGMQPAYVMLGTVEEAEIHEVDRARSPWG